MVTSLLLRLSFFDEKRFIYFSILIIFATKDKGLGRNLREDVATIKYFAEAMQ